MNLTDWPILSPLQSYFLRTVRLAFVFGNAGNEALLLTRDDCVYAIGANFLGCLGLGDETARTTPTKVPALSGINIKDFAFGGNVVAKEESNLFLVARCNNERVYHWGYGPGMGLTNPLSTPYAVNNLSYKVVEVACGLAHCMALCDNGQVFTWGSNSQGQLGRNPESGGEDLVAQNLTANRVQGLDNEFAVQIACGAYFSVVILDEGKVICWGRNKYGLIGVKDSSNEKLYPPTAASIPSGVKIQKVACGHSHVLALSKAGVLYVWGNNCSQQVGSWTKSKEFRFPTKFDPGYYVRYFDVAASYLFNFSVLVNEEYQIKVLGAVPENYKNTSFQTVHEAFLKCASFMHKPMHSVRSPRTILETMSYALEHPENSDLTIVVENDKIYVHKAVLMMRSEYFKAMLTRWVITDENVITITGKKFAAVEAYIRYIYTDKLEVDLDLAVELLILADEYGDDDFKILCEKNIENNLTIDKVAEIYAIASKLKDTENLTAFCVNFAIRHPEMMIYSAGFKDWDSDTTKTFFTQYVKKKEHDVQLFTGEMKPYL